VDASPIDSQGVTRKVMNRNSIAGKSAPIKALRRLARKPIKSGFDAVRFRGKNLTAYGGLLPVATMLEKLGSGN